MVSYFLGANSPKGFSSLYDDLIDLDSASALYILKGGPGCGKSTCMRRVAKAAEQAGAPVEYIYCSGDPDSLDAVLFPAQRAAIVDGTAPHVVEPKYPGVVDGYVDLGACYDRAALAPLREEVVHAMEGYKECYARAYRCLGAAAAIREDCRALVLNGEIQEKIARRVKGIVARELRRPGADGGGLTRRFLSAVTCRGLVCQWESVTDQCGRVYELEDSYGLAHIFLSPLLHAALAAGCSAVACPSPMDPERLEHLLLPGLGLAFVTSSPALPWPGKHYRRIRLDAMADPELLRQNRPRLRFAKKVGDALIQEAVVSLAEAKAKHDALEAVYNPHVDFALVGATADRLIRALGL